MKINSWWECLVLAEGLVASKGDCQTAGTLTMSPASGTNRSVGLHERGNQFLFSHCWSVLSGTLSAAKHVGPPQVLGSEPAVMSSGYSWWVNNRTANCCLRGRFHSCRAVGHQWMNVLMNVWMLPCSAQCFEWSCRPFNWYIKVGNSTTQRHKIFTDRKKIKVILKLLLFSYFLFSCSLFMSDNKERKKDVSIFYIEQYSRSKAERHSDVLLPGNFLRFSFCHEKGQLRAGRGLGGSEDSRTGRQGLAFSWASGESCHSNKQQTHWRFGGSVAAESKPSFCHAARVISVLRLGVVGVPPLQVSPDVDQMSMSELKSAWRSLLYVWVPSHPVCKLQSKWPLLNIITSTTTWDYLWSNRLCMTHHPFQHCSSSSLLWSRPYSEQLQRGTSCHQKTDLSGAGGTKAELKIVKI